jgi:hypothetical protein
MIFDFFQNSNLRKNPAASCGLQYDMRMINKKKTFDTVKMMLEVPDKISSETQNMTFSELKEHIDNQINESNLKAIGK